MRTMQVGFTALARKGESFAKGDRIAVDWDGEWYLATVTGDAEPEYVKPATKYWFPVRYDSGDKDWYERPYMQSKGVVKLPSDTPKSKDAHTLKDIEALRFSTDTEGVSSTVDQRLLDLFEKLDTKTKSRIVNGLYTLALYRWFNGRYMAREYKTPMGKVVAATNDVDASTPEGYQMLFDAFVFARQVSPPKISGNELYRLDFSDTLPVGRNKDYKTRNPITSWASTASGISHFMSMSRTSNYIRKEINKWRALVYKARPSDILGTWENVAEFTAAYVRCYPKLAKSVGSTKRSPPETFDFGEWKKQAEIILFLPETVKLDVFPMPVSITDLRKESWWKNLEKHDPINMANELIAHHAPVHTGYRWRSTLLGDRPLGAI